MEGARGPPWPKPLVHPARIAAALPDTNAPRRSPRGRVTAFEVDRRLAARARPRNLPPPLVGGGQGGGVRARQRARKSRARSPKIIGIRPQLCVIHGDALATPFDPADGITVNGGATRPPPGLDGLKPGGRLILPLTTDEGWRAFDAAKIARRGAVFRIERDQRGYRARWLSPVAIYPCAGARDPASEAALRRAFRNGGWERVRRLHRRGDVPAERCWLRGKGWGLAYA